MGIMGFWTTILIIILLAAIFIFVAKDLQLLGILDKAKMGMYGPFVMWKTTLGRNFIEVLAKARRLWLVFANLGIGILALCSLTMFLMIVLAAMVAFSTEAPSMSIQEILVIPGVNPMIPLWFGLIGLIIAVFVHEFAHGILSRVGKIKIKSLGILLLVIPVGAFVEPDQKEMMRARRKTRANVYAAGPASNIIFGLVCALIFSWGFMGALEPVEEGIIIHVTKDSPAQDAGIESKMQLIDINGTRIENFDDLLAYDGAMPNQTVNVSVLYEGKEKTFQVRYGLTIVSVEKGTPADKGNLSRAWIIESINDTICRSYDEFSNILSKTRAGQTVNASFLVPVSNTKGRFIRDWNGRMKYRRVVYSQNITLVDKWDYNRLNDSNKGMGFLGVAVVPMGIRGIEASGLIRILSRPVLSADSGGELFYNVFMYAFILPIEHIYLPFQSPVTEIYEVQGPMSVLPTSVFWFLANIFFYMFWLNILLGTFNSLPAFPLDGGFIFKDGMDFLVWKATKMKRQKREKVVSYIFIGMSLLVWFAIFWTLLAPFLARSLF
jgi:membrane-associated protease RseP (regulator of RpoE activity)